MYYNVLYIEYKMNINKKISKHIYFSFIDFFKNNSEINNKEVFKLILNNYLT